jgi:hypothetical protein
MPGSLRIIRIRFRSGPGPGRPSLEVAPGTVLIFVGPNNSGKSLALGEIESHIPKTISEMHIRTGANPWAKWTGCVEGIVLVEFFRYVREQKTNLILTPVDKAVEDLWGRRSA